MKARVDSARKSINQHVRLSLALLGLVMVVLVIFVPGSGANLSGSTFEGSDGNMLVGTPGHTDWTTYKDTALRLDDLRSGLTDDSFSGGTKENDTTVGITAGSIPNKDDLLRAYAATDATADGSSFLYLSWVRDVSNGDAHIDFELNQDGTTDWSGATVTIKRKVGDLLIAYDFVGNLNHVDITSFTWDGSAWSNQQDLTDLGKAEGAVNVDGPITDEIEGGLLGAGNFGEAAINLKATLNLPLDKPCATFGSMFAKTRSSGSGGNAQLKDLVLPKPIHVSTCGSIELKKQWVGKAGSTTLKIGTTAGAGDIHSTDVSGENGTTGALDETAGKYYLSETAPLPAHYTTDPLACVNNKNDGSTPVTPGTNNSIDLGVGDVIVCTFTNRYVPANPTLSTTLSSLVPITVGGTVHDSASFTGYRAPSTGTSTVTYTVYDNSTCTSNANDKPAGTVNVNHSTGSIPDSNPVTFNTAGDFYWQASFSGDDDNAAVTSLCTSEHLVVKAKPTIETSLSASSITVGGSVHDSATLTGATPDAGGSVTYKVYDNNTCTNNANTKDAGTKPVTNGNVPDSNAVTFNTVGDFYWQASYTGDTHNDPATSACTDEHLVVKAKPTIATTLSASSITVGGSVHDSATLTGATPDAGGSVTYKVYDNNTCTDNANTKDAGTKPVTNGNVPDSNAVTFNTAGDFYWQASYTGDTHNDPATSACTDEHLVVKAKPTIETSLSASSITVGGSVHDSATLTGATPDAGGSVTYKVYDNNTCTDNANTKDAGTKPVTNGNVPDSNAVTFNTVGDFYWQASYTGDGKNEPATSVCTSEHLVVNKAKPTIETSLSASSITVGGSVHDSATLTGATPDAGGSVTYKVYDNNTCTDNANTKDAGTKPVTNGNVPDSNAVTFNTAGDFYWQASYTGDGNNEAATSPCLSEHLVVNKAKPTIATTLSASSITVGGSVHDSATLTGATPDAGGSVTYKVYDNNTCTDNANTKDAGTKPVTNGNVPDSNAVTFNTAGDFYWQASYTGDGNNEAATSPCLSEHLVVNKAKPTIETSLSASSITVGGSVHDSATLTGATPDAGGSVTYKVYDNNTCTDNANTKDAGTKPVTNGNVPDSNAVTFNTAGDFYWQASYTGDGNNEAATSPCLSEHLVVNKETPSAATILHNAGNDATVANNAHLPLGSSLYDVASLTGVEGVQFSGTVTFKFFKNLDCTGEPFATQTGAAISGSSATSSPRGPLGAGPFAFNAQYVAGSDPSYNSSAVSSCEPFMIDKAQLGITTTVHDADHHDVTGSSVGLGSLVHDVAHVTGDVEGFPRAGGVTFVLYSLANCQGAGMMVSADGLENGDVRSVATLALVSGSYGFKATIAGDDNYIGKTGDCEPFTISKATPSVETTLHNASGGATVANGSHLPFGSGLYDVATLSGGGGFPFTGTVTFEFFTNSSCTGTPSTQAGVAVSGSTATSSSHTNLNAGNYAFDAKYVAGETDPNHNDSAVSGCEPFTVDKAAPSIATTLSATEVVIGTSVHDSITGGKLTGASSNAGGTVTYTVFDNNTCATNANTRDAGTVQVTNGSVPDSNALLFNTAGDFYWQAAYSGDPNNVAATSACTSEHLVVDRPAIAITKTPASQTVDSGGTATFTITVTNTGTVTLTNVTVTDPLSLNCAKTIGTLTPGQSTSYTCSQSNVTAGFTNVATVTGHPPVGPDVSASASAVVNVNPPPPPTPTPTPPTPTVDLAIVKTATPTSVVRGSNVTYTLTVTNNGPVTDTGVQVADSLPAGVTYVSATSSQGTCTGAAVVQCNIGSMTSGQKVTITIVVNTTSTGTIVNTATVVGALPETTLANNTSSTSITVSAPPAAPKPKPTAKPQPKPVFKPVVVTPKPTPPPCYAVVVTPKSLTVGSNGQLRLRVTAKNKAIPGVKVEVKGPGILKLSGRTDSAGRVTVSLHPKKPGILLVKPASYKGCTNPRIGVIAVFTPPVTG